MSDRPGGEEAAARITAPTADFMRRAIDETGGREVFFAASLNKDGRLIKPRVCARGHSGAVPAIFENIERREVVIHNHPGGSIEPSEADLELAAVYSRNGHGVYIVDNALTRVYVVVEPFLDRERERLDPKSIAEHLAPNGSIAHALPQFEIRPQQIEMMELISDAFNDDGIAVIEAPTGVGKTLAYLLPAILWAVRNRERVVVSTRTINLQEQIVFKDIPLIQKCLKETFTSVLVKGRSNYLCPRRLDRALSEATLFDDDGQSESLKAIANWAGRTEDGSKADLPFVPPRELWERVCSEADTCTAGQCQAVGSCFVTKARREIAKADIVVVNHHMLFSDLAIKRETGNFNALGVLPAFKRLILDEAHHVEDSATEYFGVAATRNGAMALLSRFQRRERGQDRGLVPYVKLRLLRSPEHFGAKETDAILRALDDDFLPALVSVREALEAAFKTVRSYAAERCGELGKDIKWRLTEEALAQPELREIHQVYVMPAVEETSKLAAQCHGLADKIRTAYTGEDVDEHPCGMEIAQLRAYGDRLLRLANVLAEGTGETLEPNTVRWIELNGQNPTIVRVARCPLEIGEPLAEWVYPNLDTLVMTSATLSVAGNFDFFKKRIGLDKFVAKVAVLKALTSPFDFEKQTVVCIAGDLVAPDSPAFLDACAEILEKTLAITQGRAFVLFTSFYALNHAYERLEQGLRKAGITPLRHGELTRTQLLERFRSDVSSVLFATDSFWEGVDVAGESLQCVILPRLPFRVPTEPILQARAEAIDLAGGNAFMDYTVPLAVIKFRQGFGRLIRRRSDRGSVVVLDSRILTKRYGRLFLESLPGARVVSGPRKSVFQALETFHRPLRKEPA